MSKKDKSDLLRFLGHFDKNIQKTVLWLRDFVWELYPQANELIYDNYNALAFGWSPTLKVSHTFCSIAVGRTSKNIHFGFYWGSKISDTKKILLGQGNQYRYLLVKDLSGFPKKYITGLIKEAYNYSLSKIKKPKEVCAGITVVKSISAKKREKKIKT